MQKEPDYPFSQTADPVLDQVQRALAESHARWTAGSAASAEDYKAFLSPLRRYEAAYAVAALESTKSTSGWTRFPKNLPPLHTSVLCRFELVGPVYDVAVYVGRDAGGAHKWVCGDINLPQERITHWSLVHEPEECLE